jgi:Ca2+-binding RTX toxin-like protein
VTFNAADYTGVVKLGLDGTANSIESVTTGSGADVITVAGVADSGNAFSVSTGAGADTLIISGTTATKVDYDGGAGMDILQLADQANISSATLNLTSIEQISLVGGNSNTMAASFISGKSFIVQPTSAAAVDLTISMDQTTLDLSKLALHEDFDATNDEVIANGSGIGLPQTITGSTAKDTITGGAGIDNINGGAGGDVLLGGNGADTITGGEGADTITGGGGDDTINLTESTAAVDKIIMNAVATNGADTVTGFVAGNDTIDCELLAGGNVAGESASAANAAEADVTTAFVHVFADGADGTGTGAASVIADYTDLADVALFLNASMQVGNGETFGIIINDLANKKAYAYNATEAGGSELSAGELTLLATISCDAALTTDNTLFQA